MGFDFKRKKKTISGFIMTVFACMYTTGYAFLSRFIDDSQLLFKDGNICICYPHWFTVRFCHSVVSHLHRMESMTKMIIPANPAAFIFRLLPLLTTSGWRYIFLVILLLLLIPVYAYSSPASWSLLPTSHVIAIAPFLLNDVRIISSQDQHGSRPRPRVPAAKEANFRPRRHPSNPRPQNLILRNL